MRACEFISESHGYHFGFQGEEVPKGLDSVAEEKSAIVLHSDDKVDIYVRGKHKGKTFSELVATQVSNRLVPAIKKFLSDKYNIRPEAVVYGPSKK